MGCQYGSEVGTDREAGMETEVGSNRRCSYRRVRCRAHFSESVMTDRTCICSAMSLRHKTHKALRIVVDEPFIAHLEDRRIHCMMIVSVWTPTLEQFRQ